MVALLTAVPALAGCSSAAEESEGRGAPRVGCVAAVATGERAPGCRGVRVRFPNRAFVPQGLALGPDRTAYVSGYDHDAGIGHRVCQLVRVHRGSGRVQSSVGLFEGVVPGYREQPCRHAGGLALTRHGLWVAGAGRLWLLDPALGPGDPVRRAWLVDERTKASTLAVDGKQLLLAPFREHRGSQVFRFALADLLAPGTTALGPAPAGPGVAVARRSRPAPSRLQGLASGPRGTWLVRSTSYCGELVAPSGRRLAFLPGAEGIDFVDGAVWAVSESGSRPYQRMGGRPDVPTLNRVDLRRLDRRTESDCW